MATTDLPLIIFKVLLISLSDRVLRMVFVTPLRLAKTGRAVSRQHSQVKTGCQHQARCEAVHLCGSDE